MAFVATAAAAAVRRAAPTALFRVSPSVPVLVAPPARTGRGVVARAGGLLSAPGHCVVGGGVGRWAGGDGGGDRARRCLGGSSSCNGGGAPLAVGGAGGLAMAARAATPAGAGGTAAAGAKNKKAGGGAKKAAAGAGKKATAAKKPVAKAAKGAAASPAAARKKAKPAAVAAASASTTPRRALVIVESPAKARTIQRILGAAVGESGGGSNTTPRYIVESCVGHVRDLPSSAKQIPAAVKAEPWARLGVDVENGFRPLYVLMPKKSKIISALRAQLADCDELVLATDEDREGEAIAWHLVQLLRPDKAGVPVQRAVFHEITPAAVTAAFASMRSIDEHLVNAQETRRVLDRLAGYTMSPLLWQKISRGLSAGRVQSVAMSRIVAREHRRLAFVRADYAGARASVTAGGGAFEVVLVGLVGRRLASGKDFDPDTGKLWAVSAGAGSGADTDDEQRLSDSGAVDVDAEDVSDGNGDGDLAVGAAGGRKRAASSAKPVLQLTKTAGRSVVKALADADGWVVDDVTRKGARRRPPPPFITSTLQQEASRRLGFPAAKTMRVAQGLYERGLITYMRTDNPTLSEQAVAATRAAITSRYGEDALGAGRAGAKPKSAQEAHEAIRPAGEVFALPADAGLEGDDARLYALVFRRTLASQMADAAVDTTTITVRSPPLPPALRKQLQSAGKGGSAAEAGIVAADVDACGVFRASGTIVVSPGFLSVYNDTFGAPAADAAEVDASDSGLPSAPVSSSAMSARPGTSTTAAQVLPDVVPGEPVAVSALDLVEHTTTPPARYTDASLVKELEALGVGRPSTYASIVETLVLRGYVSRGTRETAGRLPPQALAPRLTAFVVDQLLRRYFPSFVDAAFTAEMERSLDAIAAGAADRQEYLSSYYLGSDGLAASVARMEKEIDTAWARRLVLPTAGSGAPAGRGTRAGAGAKRKKGDGGGLAAGAEVFVGPYGPYIELPRDVIDAGAGGAADGTREVIKASLPAATLADDLSADRLEQILSRALDPVIGTDPTSGLPVLVRTGRYGPYVQLGRDEDWVPEEKPKRKPTKKAAAAAAEAEAAAAAAAASAASGSSPALTADGKRIGKPKRASLLAGMDVGDVTLPTALRILSLPRLLGTHPTLGGEVKAGMGRFGPYVVHEGVFVSLKGAAAAPSTATAGAADGTPDGEGGVKDAPSATTAAAAGATPDATAADDGGPAAGDPDQWRQVLNVGLDEAVALLGRPRPPRRAYAGDKAKRVKASV